MMMCVEALLQSLVVVFILCTNGVVSSEMSTIFFIHQVFLFIHYFKASLPVSPLILLGVMVEGQHYIVDRTGVILVLYTGRYK